MQDNFKDRQVTIQLVFFLGALIMVIRALQLQVLDQQFKSTSKAATMSTVTIYPTRGVMYDRNDTLLVFNEPIYDIMVTYNLIDQDMDIDKLCKILEIDRATYDKRISPDWNSPQYSKSVPFIFLSKVPFDRIPYLTESLYEFPGFELKTRSGRGYPSEHAAHLLGYIREVNKEEVKKSRDSSILSQERYVYHPGDYIGDGGLEKQYETILRGKKGQEVVLKDNLGRKVSLDAENPLNKEAKNGGNLLTTIDVEVQRYAEEIMKNKRGGIVAIEPKTGEVLVLVSSPSYDPRKLSISADRSAAFSQLIKDPNLPFYDRAVMAQYPPGSLFKSIVALIGMQRGVLTKDRTISCAGAYYFDGKPLTGCHAHTTCRGVASALQHSCNTYFVTVFKSIIDQNTESPSEGLDIFNQYLEEFGLGKPLGIDFPREQPGNFPTSAYYSDKVYKDEPGGWRSLWIRSLGIGQGELLMTTLQMANLAATIGNKGHYTTPHLIKGIAGEQGDTTWLDWENNRTRVSIDEEHFIPVMDGLENAVRYGTARRAYINDIVFCGKTGTAENNQNNQEDHSIFMGFAPKEDPQIAIAVFIENAGFGGTYAAPIASLIVEKMLKREIRGPQRKWLENQMKEANFLIQPEEEAIGQQVSEN